MTEMRLRFSGAIALTTAACAAPSATCRAQSTQLAGAMDAGLYFGFLHRYFAGMAESILKTGAEIYKYVGS